jgi:hypothetical protein
MEVKAKGIEHPVTLYEALGVGRPHKLYLPERGETALSLTEAVPFRYEIVEANFSGRSLAGKQCPRAHSQPTLNYRECQKKGEETHHNAERH